MDWCEDNGIDYVFGLSGNRLLAAAVDAKADDIRTRRALKQMLVLRGYAQTRYAAKSWRAERRVCARIEATELGLDIRYVVTNIAEGSPEHIYDTLYCARGQMDIDQAWRLSRFCGGGGGIVGGPRRHAAPGRRRGAYRLQRRDRLRIGAHQHGSFRAAADVAAR